MGRKERTGREGRIERKERTGGEEIIAIVEWNIC